MKDWIVAGINNPNMEVGDFKNVLDMNTSNTLMLSKDDYLKSDFVKNSDLFKALDGSFDKKKFDDFYNYKLAEWQLFSTGNYYDGPALDPFDIRRTEKTKVKTGQFSLGTGFKQGEANFNPMRLQIGIEGINVWSDPTMSAREIAQGQNVKGKDWTPNDHALFSKPLEWIKDLFSEPLALATWDEEGYDPETGIKHKAGDYKYNENGTFYYEPLNGRSPVGREILSSLDLLTVDGTAANKYDFFDSDDVEKSVGGVILKNVAALAPMFIGGPVGAVYNGFLITRELAKSLPLLYDMTTSLFGTESTPEWMNNLAGAAYRLTSTQSDYSRTKALNVETLGSMIADVALQWGLQKTIANAVSKVKGAKNYIAEAEQNAFNLYMNKIAEYPALVGDPRNWKNSALGQAALKMFMPEAEKMAVKSGLLGRDLSLAYMSIISNSDVFLDAVNHGASRKEAAAIALGSTLGMYKVDKTGIGELFFDDATENSVKSARKLLRDEARKAREDVYNSVSKINMPELNKYLKYIKAGIDSGKRAFKKFKEDVGYHMTNGIEKALGEGLEEVSEEFVTDASKGLYELAGKFGFDTSSKDVGAWENADTRYGMSFLGGAIGGSIFYGKEAWDRDFKHDKNNEELVTLIRNGHTLDLYSELDKLEEEGNVGNSKLSATKYETDSEGNRVFLSTVNKDESQNARIALLIREKITAIDTVLNNNQVNLSDDLLFKNMVLGEERMSRYLEISGATNYYQDFANVLNGLLDAEDNLLKAYQTMDGTPNGAPIPNDTALHALSDDLRAAREELLNKLRDAVAEARTAKDDFLSGKTSLDYTRKLNFAIDPVLSDQFLPTSFEAMWNKEHKDKLFQDATAEELEKFIEKYKEYKQSSLYKDDLTKAWKAYKDVEKILAPEITLLGDPNYKRWFEKFLEIRNSKAFDTDKLKETLWNVDTRLEGEDDDTYEHRNKKYINPVDGTEEDNSDYVNRVNARNKIIQDHNIEEWRKWADNLKSKLDEVNGKIDPIAEDWLRKNLQKRIKDIVPIYLENPSSAEKSIYDTLKTDMSNKADVLLQLKELAGNNVKNEANNLLNLLQNLTYTDDNGDEYDLRDLLESDPSLEDITLSDIVDDEFDIEDIDENTLKKIKNLSEGLLNFYDGDTALIDIANQLSLNENILNLRITEAQNIAEQTHSRNLNQIEQNPITQLYAYVDTSVVNPIQELVTKLVGKTLNGKQVKDAEEILKIVRTNFDTVEDLSELEMNGSQIETLQDTLDALNMVRAYIHAASATANTMNPIGHNKMINEFARNHSDLVENWDELPEIDTDYAAIYLQGIEDYKNNVLTWINFSVSNSINKKALFIKTDSAFLKSFLDYIINKELKFTVNDKEYDLSEGGDTEDLDVALFEKSKAIYKNFQKALKESGLSAVEFIRLSGIFNDFNQVGDLRSASLSSLMTSANLTDYDKAIYLASILTSDPSLFFKKLKTKILNNDGIAPITAQEYGSQILVASLNQDFRDVVLYIHLQSGDTRAGMYNTVFLNGVAGAGKTEVVIKSIKDFVPVEDILAVGPTSKQAEHVKSVLGLQSAKTIKEVLESVLGVEEYADLQNEINNISTNDEGIVKDNKWFTGKIVNGLGQYSIKSGIKFKPGAPKQKVMVIDEATHLSSLEALILDQYMKSIGGTLILAGDMNQNGFSKPGTGLGSVEEFGVFTIRTPKLNISLRDNNIQKQENLTKVKALLDLILDSYYYDSTEEFNSKFANWEALIKKLNFEVYNDDDINGDLITSSITPTLKLKLETLKRANPDATFGFIGDTSSDTYTKLQSIVGDNVFNVDEMQGQEFDYVIIDLDFSLKPDNSAVLRKTLQNVYTLMSRGKTASIFIDKGLSNIIGSNKVLNFKAKAPSLKDVVNGKSAVQELIEKKLAILDKYKIEDTEEEETPTEKPKKNPSEIFLNPEERPDDGSADRITNGEGKPDPKKEIKIDSNGDYGVISYSNAHFLSVETEDHTLQNSKGESYSGKLWVIKHDASAPFLRNLLAINPEGETRVFWYLDKVELQQKLDSIRQYILHNRAYGERLNGRISLCPQVLSDNFTEADYNNRKLILEIREANETLPLHSNLKNIGFKYKDKQYIVEIVCEIKNKNGLLCRFDLTGVNDPATLGLYIDSLPDSDEKTKAKSKKAVYDSFIEKWINEYEAKGKLEIDVTKAVDYDLAVRLRKAALPLRLGGYVNPESNTTDVKDLQHKHPELLFSDPYTYCEKNLSDLDIQISSDKNRGRACVFVTDELYLPKDRLRELYEEHKLNKGTNHPTIRMVLLDNYGMTISQLTDNDWLSTFATGTKENEVPYRQNYTGLQMYIAMWNWRASLKQFNKAYNDYWGNDPRVETITKAALDIYDEIAKKTFDASKNRSFPERISPSDKEEITKKVLESSGVTKEELEKLEKFNLEVLKDIPMFRLGYPNKNDYYILQINTKNSNLYDKDTANVIMISKKGSDFFEKLSDRVFPSMFGNRTLNPEEAIYLEKQDHTEWKPDELIQFDDAHRPLTASGLFRMGTGADKGTVHIKNKDGVEVAFLEGDSWSALPKLVGMTLETADFYMHNPDAEERPIRVGYTSSKTLEGNHRSIHIKDIVEGDHSLLKNVNSPDKYGDYPDPRLRHMFDLMFHGTVEDIHKPGIQQANLVRFPDGFKIHPDTLVVASDSVLNPNDKFIQLRTHPGLLTSDVEPEGCGLYLMLDKLNLTENVVETNNEPYAKVNLSPNTKVTVTTSTGLQVEGIINDNQNFVPTTVGCVIKIGDLLLKITDYLDGDIYAKEEGGFPRIIDNINTVTYAYADSSGSVFDFSTVKEVKEEDKHPIMTLLIKDLSGVDKDAPAAHVINEYNKQKLKDNFNGIASSIASEGGVKSDSDILNEPYTYKKGDDDLVPVSFKEWLIEQISGDFNEITYDDATGHLIVDGKWEVDGKSVTEIKLLLSAQNRLQKEVEGKNKKVGDVISEVLNDTLTSLKDDPDGIFVDGGMLFDVTNSDALECLTSFIGSFDNLMALSKDLDDTQILNELKELFKDSDGNNSIILDKIKEIIEEVDKDILSSC